MNHRKRELDITPELEVKASAGRPHTPESIKVPLHVYLDPFLPEESGSSKFYQHIATPVQLFPAPLVTCAVARSPSVGNHHQLAESCPDRLLINLEARFLSPVENDRD